MAYIYIVVGALGFLVAPVFEVASLKRSRAKPAVGFVSVGLIVFATLMVCLRSERLALPGWLSSVGWCLLILSVIALTYSLLVNLPFRRTYVAPGVGDRLVTTGAYALVRHPGVLGYALFLISLVLVTESKLLLIAFPVWMLMEIAYVLIQDKYLFGRMFPGYADYRRNTPMLIPTRKSISACLRTLKPARLHHGVQGRRGQRCPQ